MKIRHLSLTAQHPETAAQRLAELSGGVAERFPSKTMSGAWLCVWNKDENELIEFIPDDYRLVFSNRGAEYQQQEQRQNFNASHVMIETKKSVEWLKRTADKHGLVHRFRPSFGGPLYDIWLEKYLLIEFFSKEIELLETL